MILACPNFTDHVQPPNLKYIVFDDTTRYRSYVSSGSFEQDPIQLIMTQMADDRSGHSSSRFVL